MMQSFFNCPLPEDCCVDSDFDELFIPDIAHDHPAWFSNEIQSIGELVSQPYHFKKNDIPHFWDRHVEEQARAERKKQIEFERAEALRAWHEEADIPTGAEGQREGQRSPHQVQPSPQPEPERVRPEPTGWWTEGLNGAAYRRWHMERSNAVV